MDVPPWLWLMKSPSLPCLEEFSLRRLFGALSLHLQELWGSPLAKWNTLPRANPQSPSPTPHPTRKKLARSGAFWARCRSTSSCTSNSLLAAWLELLILPRSATYFGQDRWKLCVLNMFKLQKMVDNWWFIWVFTELEAPIGLNYPATREAHPPVKGDRTHLLLQGFAGLQSLVGRWPTWPWPPTAHVLAGLSTCYWMFEVINKYIYII